MTRHDYARWTKAWEQGMAERGYPNARLTVYATENTTGGVLCSYSWTHDINAALDPAWDGGDGTEWQAAHDVFLAVDSQRPEAVVPSIMLTEMLLAEPDA